MRDDHLQKTIYQQLDITMADGASAREIVKELVKAKSISATSQASE